MAPIAKRQKSEKIPVTVLTGFLGSGKTTLLNHILTQDHGLKVAVIENEYGEVGVDDALVKKKFESDEEVFEMNNGCVCCTVRGDLIRIIKKLIKRKQPLDAILIETTGLADPAPVAQTFFMDDEIKAHARLDGIITVVDCKHILEHLLEEKPEGVENEAVEQVAFADRLLLNKIDLVKPEELAEAKAKIREINKEAKMIECTFSEVPLEEVLGVHGFDLERVLTMDPEFLSEDQEHMHDTRVTSVGIRVVGELDMDKLNGWISTLLRTKGADIYRMKGIFAIQGMENKFVFHGVHMIFDGRPLENQPWGADEPKENRCIFIGKNLNESELRASFNACMV